MSSDSDQTVERLLRIGGPRHQAAADVEARVRHAFLVECREARRRVVRHRAIAAAAALAAAAGMVLAVRPVSQPVAGPTQPGVAFVERVDGDPGWRSNAGDDARNATLQLAAEVRANEWIATGAAGRMGIRTAAGVSVRLDRESRMRMTSATAVEVATGSIYIDSGNDAPPLDVSTPLGVVRDLGTQFEVRVTASTLRVRVRSGLVELLRDGQLSHARAGTELTATATAVGSSTIAPFGAEWEWTARLAPPFSVEGKTLAAYLEYVCREQGWTLKYADSALQREITGVVVHGSVEGLAPLDALSVVLAASDLVHGVGNGELRVARRRR